MLLEIVVGENWTCGEKGSKKKSGQKNSVSLYLFIFLSLLRRVFVLSSDGGGAKKRNFRGEVFQVFRFSRLELHDRREIL